jgi:hypothetical protein
VRDRRGKQLERVVSREVDSRKVIKSEGEGVD